MILPPHASAPAGSQAQPKAAAINGAAFPGAVPVVSIDDELLDIIALLHTAPIRSFDLSTAAVITGPFIEGRVCIRMDGRSWSLPTVSCSVLALLVRLERSLRACDLFADAFNAAVVQAEAKVDAVNAWSARVRPTEGDEG
ncbi:hypothetical protein [Brevundimonas naejangsanensis]|uniref:hypothetical protein n=1 Tax=Brevundimonas naejangsanensis TaxID=588932 RepID=UPI0026EF21D7|nr:hypothetical protein [Brevundimonas naejangsanensis]